MKKIVAVVTVLFSALVLSGCAGTSPTVEVNTVAEHNRKVVEPVNTQSRLEIVKAKLISLAEHDLRKVNAFLDSLWEAKADPRKEIMVMVVEKDMEFPPLLEEIIKKHPKLNQLPRDPSTLYVVESARAPGVKNVFIKVPASAIGEQDGVYDWMPSLQEWQKFVDLKLNKLQGKTPEEAFLVLFAKANERLNPELIAPVEGKHLPPEKQWDWARMPHPKTIGSKCMYIPLATVTGPLAEFF